MKIINKLKGSHSPPKEHTQPKILYCFLSEITTSTDEVHLTPDSSPELTKRSWFGNLMTTEKDETFTVLVKGKPIATVKAHLIHAFLSVSD